MCIRDRYEPDPDYTENYAYRSQRRRTSYSQASKPPRGSKDPLIGTRVRHSKYGLGTIIEIEGEGEDRKLTVSFQDYGAKKLVERYANLQLA